MDRCVGRNICADPLEGGGNAFLGTLLLLDFLVFCGIANVILCVPVFNELSWMGMCQEGVMGVPTVQPFTPALCSAGVPALVAGNAVMPWCSRVGVLCVGSRAH